MALKGELSEFTVEQVLRLLQLSAQTGTLDVRAPAGKTSVEVTGGAVSNVRRTDDPEIALGRALLSREGTFTFKPGPTTERVIDAPLDELIERSRAKAAEAIEIEAAIPDENVRFRLSARATSGGAFTVGSDELKVLMEVGGGRSVREIRQRSRTPRSRAAALLYGLLQKGLVERTESESAVAVQVTGPASRPRRRRPAAAEAAAAPAHAPAPAAASTAERPIEIARAPVPIEALPPDMDAADLSDELDARLAAIADLAPAAQPPPASAQPSDELIVVTPSVGPAATAPAGAESVPEATVVFALHYMPLTAQPVEPAPPPARPKRRGLFDFVLRRPSAGIAQPDIDIPAPADIASLANRLHAEYRRQAEAMSQLASYSDRATRAFEETLSARLARVYGMRAVGSRVPLRGDAIDVDAIRSGEIAPAQILPYLALLVRDLRDEAIRAFGPDDARATYETAAAGVFGRQMASPTMILRHADVPQRGRLTVRGGSAGPFELREGTYIMGRAKDCDMVLGDVSVSGHHARIVSGIAGYTLTDLSSRNGTTVNGARLTGAHTLRSADLIGLGDTVLVYEQLAPQHNSR